MKYVGTRSRKGGSHSKIVRRKIKVVRVTVSGGDVTHRVGAGMITVKSTKLLGFVGQYLRVYVYTLPKNHNKL